MPTKPLLCSRRSMHLRHLVLPALAALAAVHAAPSMPDASPSYYESALSEAVSPAAGPLLHWITSSLGRVLPLPKLSARPSVYHDAQYGALDVPEYRHQSIWHVIQSNEHLHDLKRVLKYSGPATRALLDDKEKKLTFLGECAAVRRCANNSGMLNEAPRSSGQLASPSS